MTQLNSCFHIPASLFLAKKKKKLQVHSLLRHREKELHWPVCEEQMKKFKIMIIHYYIF